MSPPVTVPRDRWWIVIGYEVSMLRGFLSIPPKDALHRKWLLHNNIAAGLVLHTRNLCDFCTSKDRGDIKPSDLFENYATDLQYKNLES
jgi:hypothetical protein